MSNILNIRKLFQFFPFHLVTPSPWPILVSFALFNLVISGVNYMQGYSNGGNLSLLNLIVLVSFMSLWFRDVANEGALLGDHTKQVKRGLSIGFVLFVISEIFAFLSVFWAFFHSSLSPAIELGGYWPPQGIQALNAFAIPLLNTVLLLSSGAFITFGHHSLVTGLRRETLIGIIGTILLALLFTAIQGYEYSEASFTFSDSVFGSAFFASTGLHGIHVIVGTLFILVALFRTIQYQLTRTHHQGFESSILYWHFVDVVWLFRAPVWIFSGSGQLIALMIYFNSIALLKSVINYAILVTTTLGKLINLSDSEMDRGVQHVGKADNGGRLYSNPRSKDDHGLIILFSGTLQNPFSYAILIIMSANRNVAYIVVIITQYPLGYKKHRPKIIKSRGELIQGFPKGSNSYGNGALILGNRKGSHSITKVGQRTYSTSTRAVNEKFNGRDLLSKVRVLNGKYYDLYKLLCDEDFLFGAYYSIKSNPGNMTPGTDKETFDGISKAKIAKLAAELKNESFKFKPSKKVFIPKANGKTIPLGIPSPMDKIVQKAMAILLELVFELNFSNYSHGFRPNRGCHTAMRQLAQWSGTQWAIEGDIKGFFDNVDHHILANLLSAKIGDQQFIDLYWKLVRAGYVEEGVKRDSLLGVPQGGIVSPILSNIYLHHFDQFIEELIDKYHSKAKDITTKNPKYDKATRRIQYLRDKYPNVIQRDEKVRKEIKDLLKLRRTIPSRLPNGTRLRYVRYADDWVVGFYGREEMIKEILIQIRDFLKNELKIELSPDKTKITNLLRDKGLFLGFYFMVYKPKESKFTIIQKKGVTRRTKISHNRMWLLVPMDRILNKLNNEGFLKEYKLGSKIVPQAKSNWIFLDHHGILSRYNSLSRGLLNYYSIATNRHVFHHIINFILRHSCAKTLGRKLNLRSRKKVFTKFGYELLTKTKPVMKFFTEPNYRRIPFNKWPKHTIIKDPFDFLKWELRTQTNFWDPC